MLRSSRNSPAIELISARRSASVALSSALRFRLSRSARCRSSLISDRRSLRLRSLSAGCGTAAGFCGARRRLALAAGSTGAVFVCSDSALTGASAGLALPGADFLYLENIGVYLPALSGLGFAFAEFMQRHGEFGDFLAQRVLARCRCQRCAVISGLSDRATAIGQLDLDRDLEAFGQPLDPALAVQIGEFRGAVQTEAQLLGRQLLGSKRPLEAQRVLRRAHIQF